jgi:hypothetical protein
MFFHPGHNTHVAFVIHPSTMVHLDVVPSYPDIHMGHLSSSQPASHQKWCILMLFYPSHIYTWGIFHPSIHNGACGCSFILAMYTHGASLIHSSIHRQWCIWIHFHHGYIYMVSQPSIHPSIHPFVWWHQWKNCHKMIWSFVCFSNYGKLGTLIFSLLQQ